MERIRISALLLATLVACSPRDRPDEAGEFALSELTALMEELASAWNEGDAGRAAACFTEDAVYVEPPAKQVFRGRESLFEFFGGHDGRPGLMSMTWHHLAFNAETSVGFGEFSFTYGTTAHGVAVVRIADGKIASWREYWYPSELPWEEFIGENPF